MRMFQAGRRVGTSAAGPLVVLAVTLGVTACGGPQRPSVLGVEITRPTTTTIDGGLAPTPGEDGATPSIPAPTAPTPTDRPDAGTSGGTAVKTSTPATVRTSSPTTAPPRQALPPSSTTTSAPPRGESLAPGTYREASDHSELLVTEPDGRHELISATQQDRDPPPQRIDVGLSFNGNGPYDVVIVLADTSGRPIAFPGGLDAAVTCSRDQTVVASFSITDPTLTELAAGDTVSRTGTSIVADEAGTYHCEATLTVALR